MVAFTSKGLEDLAKRAAAKPAPAGRGNALLSKSLKGMLGSRQAPHGTSGSVSERPYSFTRAAAFKLGMLDADQAKEELHYSGEIRKWLRGCHGSGSSPIPLGGDQFYVPLSPRHFGGSMFNPNPHAERLTRELTQKMAMPKADTEGFVRKTMATATEGYGGSLVAPPAFGDLIELQGYASILNRLGCTRIPMPPQGSIVYPRIDGTGTSYHINEAPTPGASPADIATGQFTLTAKTLITLVDLSLQLQNFGGQNVEAAIRYEMARCSSQKKDQTVLFTGTGGQQPLALTKYPRQTQFVQGNQKCITYSPGSPSDRTTNGYYLRPNDVVSMPSLLPDELDNEYGWVMRPELLATIETASADAVTAGDRAGPFKFPLLRDPADYLNFTLAGGKVARSRLVPASTLGTGTVYPVIVGRWKDLVLAEAGIGIIDSNLVGSNAAGTSYFATATMGLRLLEFYDAGPRLPASFVIADSVLSAGY